MGADSRRLERHGRSHRARPRRGGYNIAGVHLDFRAGLAHVEEIKAKIAAAGREALYFNMNAADDEKRADAIRRLQERFAGSAGARPYVRVLMHSLAFGTLLPFIADDPKAAISRKQLEMTLDVMANSLVYWTQDLVRAGLLGSGSRVFAMTSEGSSRAVPTYGAVSAAKSALESHCRQLSMELARKGTGITVNAIRAGVTITPALMKIPERDAIIESSMRRNPIRTDDDSAGRRAGDRGAERRRVRFRHRQRHRRRRRRVHHGLVDIDAGR